MCACMHASDMFSSFAWRLSCSHVHCVQVFDDCLRSIKWEGRMVVIGFLSGDIPKVCVSVYLWRWKMKSFAADSGQHPAGQEHCCAGAVLGCIWQCM